MDVQVYTDGASRGNPGPGGYGIVMIAGKHRKELSKGFRLTTNNRMELLAVIVALESMKSANLNISIYTDSKYVVDSIEKKWVFAWQSAWGSDIFTLAVCGLPCGGLPAQGGTALFLPQVFFFDLWLPWQGSILREMVSGPA